jgi:plastocyanin
MRTGIQTKARIATIALALTLAIVGSANLLAQADESKLPTAEIKIDNFSFGPVLLTVAPGTKVTWTNRDDIPHTIVADDKTFKSKALDTDEAFSYTFDKPGTYPYFCSLHPHMTGQVVVK